MLDEVGPQLGRLCVDVGEDAVEVAVGVDELGGRLLAHAGDAGQVVGRITAERRVEHVLVGPYAGALEDAGLVVERVVADAALVVEDLDVRVVDQLVAVAVARDDDGRDVLGLGLGGQRRDDVVGLDAGLVDDRDLQRLDQLAHEPHLLAEDVGARLAVGLVGGHHLVAERRLGAIERDRDQVGLVVALEVDEHRREPEHGVGDLPRRRGHVGREREERPVRERVAIDEHQGRHRGQT